MTTTEQPNSNVLTAFINAQKDIGRVRKNAKNTFFKTPAGKASGYIDLAALNAAVTPVLAKHDLAFLQRVVYHGDNVYIESHIQHTDGGRLESSYYPIICKDMADPQKFGGAVTYARRYSKMLYLDLAAEDDDGNTASLPPADPRKKLEKDLTAALKAAGLTTSAMVNTSLQESFPDVPTVKDLTNTQIEQWITTLTQPNF